MKIRTCLCGVAVALGCAAAVLAAEDIAWVCKMEDHPAPVTASKDAVVSSSAAVFDASWLSSVASFPADLNLVRPGLCILVK